MRMCFQKPNELNLKGLHVNIHKALDSITQEKLKMCIKQCICDWSDNLCLVVHADIFMSRTS